MDSVLKNILPQVGILNNEENPTIDSDRVKAPVAGAGFTDFGGSQKHNVANQAGAEGDNRLAPTVSQKTSEEEKAEAEVDHVEKLNKGKVGKGDPHKVSQADLELGVPRGTLPKTTTTRNTKSPVHGRNTNS